MREWVTVGDRMLEHPIRDGHFQEKKGLRSSRNLQMKAWVEKYHKRPNSHPISALKACGNTLKETRENISWGPTTKSACPSKGMAFKQDKNVQINTCGKNTTGESISGQIRLWKRSEKVQDKPETKSDELMSTCHKKRLPIQWMAYKSKNENTMVVQLEKAKGKNSQKPTFFKKQPKNAKTLKSIPRNGCIALNKVKARYIKILDSNFCLSILHRDFR
jgi:hypothetical protein